MIFSHDFRDLGLKPHLYSITPITPLLNLRRKDTFESPEIRSPTFDAKAQIFEIRIPMLKPGVQKIQMVTKYFVKGSSWVIQGSLSVHEPLCSVMGSFLPLWNSFLAPPRSFLTPQRSFSESQASFVASGGYIFGTSELLFGTLASFLTSRGSFWRPMAACSVF